MVRGCENRLGMFVLLFVIGAAIRVAPAQQSEDGVVSGVGTSMIERSPNLLRMQVDISGSGKNTAEAIAKLREAEKAARAKLTQLGAAEKSITTGPVRDGGVKNARQQQMEMMMMRQRMQGGARKPAAAAPPMAQVSATIKAEWPLTAAAGDEMLVKSSELKQKIMDADVAGQKVATATLTPEQQEEADELKAMALQFGEDESGGASGGPKFVFVATLTEEEQSKATAEAFGKAKTSAARLAKAAGATLGALRTVTEQSVPTSGPQEGNEEYAAAYMYSMMGARGASVAAMSGQPPTSAEATGSQPSNVGLRVVVSASFNVK